METQSWQDKQLNAARNLTNQGSQALRQNHFDAAEPLLTEADAILDMIEESDQEVVKLRAQLCNEIGFVKQRQEKTDEALALHSKAVDLCNGLIEDGVEFRANTAATHINLAGLLAQNGDFDKAKEVNRVAVKLADSLVADDGADVNAVNLAFGAHQNLAVISARGEDLETADAEMTKAIEVLSTGASPEMARQASVQIAQGAQQLSVIFFNADNFDGALRWGKIAEEYSEKAYEVHGEPVLSVYVTSQINLISFYEKLSDFAGAEDSLFKTLDVVGNHPDILARGKAFYEEIRKLADARLEAGNLPRAEVEDSYKEILERLASAGVELEAEAQA